MAVVPERTVRELQRRYRLPDDELPRLRSLLARITQKRSVRGKQRAEEEKSEQRKLEDAALLLETVALGPSTIADGSEEDRRTFVSGIGKSASRIAIAYDTDPPPPRPDRFHPEDVLAYGRAIQEWVRLVRPLALQRGEQIAPLSDSRNGENHAPRAAQDMRVAAPTHSADFTSVNWFGTDFTFSAGHQAKSVQLLWQAWKNGTPTLAEATIGEGVGSGDENFRLAKVFVRNRKKHPAWGTMIRRAAKGVFRLVAPNPT